MDSQPVDVNGAQPSLIGHACSDLVVEEYWHRGELDTPANVVWLRIDSVWHRLYFDCGTVFWRIHDGDGPEAYDLPELEARVRLRDLGRTLGFAGRMIKNVITRSVARGAEVAFEWDSGERLVFGDVDDKTSYYTG